METFRNFLLVSVVLIFILVFYRWILRMLKNRLMLKRKYPYVFPFESNELRAAVSVRVDMPYHGDVVVEIHGEEAFGIRTVYTGALQKGIAEFEFNVKDIPTGDYTLILRFPDETVRRFVRIAGEVRSLR